MDEKEAFLDSALLAPDERPLLLAILDAPQDDATRLVYADWLEERGGEGSARGEFLRIQHQLRTAQEPGPLRSCEAVLRSGINPAWLSLMGDTPAQLLVRWHDLAVQIATDDGFVLASDLADALQVSSDQGLLDVRYDAMHRNWDERALALLAGREVAPVLRSLRLVGTWSSGGVRPVHFDALLAGHAFSHLTVFEVERQCEDGVPWIGGLEGERGALGRFLNKAPMLRGLISPSAPDATFFQQGERPIEELQIVAGLEHQGFIRNLAQSSCFPRLCTLVWSDTGLSRRSTPAEDYFALFASPAIAGVRWLHLRDVYLTPEQIRQLLAIRNEGVEITPLHAPHRRP